jgi:hypothetical protein
MTVRQARAVAWSHGWHPLALGLVLIATLWGGSCR